MCLQNEIARSQSANQIFFREKFVADLFPLKQCCGSETIISDVNQDLTWPVISDPDLHSDLALQIVSDPDPFLKFSEIFPKFFGKVLFGGLKCK